MFEKTLSAILILLLIPLSFVYYLEIKGEASNVLYSDYGKFYLSGRLANQGQSLYTTLFFQEKDQPEPTAEYLHRLPSNLNPPFFQWLLYPLSLPSYTVSLYLWLGFSFFCALCSAILTIRILDLKYRFAPLIGSVILLLYYPTLISMQFGQVTLFLLPILLTAWWAARNAKPDILGICLAIAVNVKLFFGLFLLYFLMRREWRALRWFSLTTIICLLLPLTIFKLQDYSDYHLVLHHIWWYSSSWNASIWGFVLRLFGGEEKNLPLFHLPALTNNLYWILASSVFLIVLKFLTPATKIPAIDKTNLDFSMIVIAMLLLAPLTWIYYFPFLLIPVVVLIKLIETQQISAYTRYILSTAIILSSMPYSLLIPVKVFGANTILITSGVYFYALILFLGLIIFARQAIQADIKINTKSISRSLIILVYIMALLPSAVGLAGVVSALIKNTNIFMPKMLLINPY